MAFWKVLLVSVAVCGLAWMFSGRSPGGAAPPSAPATADPAHKLSDMWEEWNARGVNFNVQPVAEVTWKDNPDFVAQLFRSQVPVRLHGCPVRSWDVLSPRPKWTPDYLADTIPELIGVGWNASNASEFVYYDTAKPLQDVIQWTAPHVKLNMSTAQFFGHCGVGSRAASTARHQVYFSGNIAAPSLRPLASDLKPMQELLGRYIKERKSYQPPADLVTAHLWMGCQGVDVRVHNDAVHNIFVQVYGRKRFILFPPAASKALYPHSRLHPSARQSQLNLSAAVDAKFSEFYQGGVSAFDDTGSTRLEGREVVLQPGDALYLPPYWFHKVTALDNSVSLSVWIDAEDHEWFHRASSVPIPKLDGADDMRRVGYAHYVMLLLGYVHYITDKRTQGTDTNAAVKSGAQLLRRLITARVATLQEATWDSAQVMRWLPSCRLDRSEHEGLLQQLEEVAKGVALEITRMPHAPPNDGQSEDIAPTASFPAALSNLADLDVLTVVQEQTLDYVEEFLRVSLADDKELLQFMHAMGTQCVSVWS